MSTLRSSIKQAVGRSQGQTFWVKATLTSSGISTTAANLTPVVTGGELAIKQVILQTDATGLAGGTDFELQTTNAKGLAVFASTAVSGLGANKTVQLSGMSVTGIPTVLERGAQIQYLCTGSACTGTGTVDVRIQFERLDDGAQLSTGGINP